MKIHQNILWMGVGIGLLYMSVSGCVSSTPSPRMQEFLGLPMKQNLPAANSFQSWPDRHHMALMVRSDATGPEAAPAISPSMLSLLSQRTQAYLLKHCDVTNIQVIPSTMTQRDHHLPVLLEKAKSLDAQSLLLVLFSSTESSEAGTFGEERMMTQMPGLTTYNTAVVELGLVNIDNSRLERYAAEQATESVDQLNVPIGDNQPTKEEALDIVRANAGQQALDLGLQKFTQGCRA